MFKTATYYKFILFLIFLENNCYCIYYFERSYTIWEVLKVYTSTTLTKKAADTFIKVAAILKTLYHRAAQPPDDFV